MYPCSSFVVLPEFNGLYPLLISLGSENIYAYSTRFMIKATDLPKIESMIFSCFHKRIGQVKEGISYGGKMLYYYKFEEFNQTVIDVITNNDDLIKGIWSNKLEPPAPDIVFPDDDFESQGKMALW